MVEKTSENINKMFNEISDNYDLMNNLISCGFHSVIKKKFIKDIPVSGDEVILDLCCGTGDLMSYLLQEQHIKKVIGLDFSERMLNIAKDRLKCYSNVEFLCSDCINIPMDEFSVDICTMGFGLRNIENYTYAINEVYRVLKYNGYFAHIDIFKGNCIVNKLFDFYILLITKLLNIPSGPYKYLSNSKNEFLSAIELSDIIESNGFKLITSKSWLMGMINYQIYMKK